MWGWLEQEPSIPYSWKDPRCPRSQAGSLKPCPSSSSASPASFVLVSRHAHFFPLFSTWQLFRVIWLLLIFFPPHGISCLVNLQDKVTCLLLILPAGICCSSPSVSCGALSTTLLWSDSAPHLPWLFWGRPLANSSCRNSTNLWNRIGVWVFKVSGLSEIWLVREP